jgi:hypothetical protein
MPENVQLDFADNSYFALPFGISFPTWADAFLWLTAQGYEPQDNASTLWMRAA